MEYTKGQVVNEYGIKYIREVRRGNNYARICEFECHCGNVFNAKLSAVKNTQKSCGCMKSKPPVNIKHGESGTTEYVAWSSMMSRCYSEKHMAFHRYGGRGISVCDEWHDVSVFCKWARDNGCKKGLQLDRIDNDGNYEPKNCRFVTPGVNSKNRIGTKWWHTPEGVFPSLKDACDHYGKWIAKRFYRPDMPEYYAVDKYEND